MTISRKNGLAMTAEVFLVLPLERVAGRAQPQRKNLLAPTGTADRTLNRLLLHRSHDDNAPRFNCRNLNHPAVYLEQCSIIASDSESRIKVACSSNRVEVFTADHFPLNVEPAASANYSHHFPPLRLIVGLFGFRAFASTFSFTGPGLTIRSMVDFDTLNIVPSSCFEY